MSEFEASKLQIARQVFHWTTAAARLRELESFASREAWNSLESYMGVAIRQKLGDAVNRLLEEAAILRAELSVANTNEQLERVRQRLQEFRNLYLRTETTLDFYGDAINTRTNAQVAAILRACDALASKSMSYVLDQLGKTTPPVLTYLDRGLGASILKAGLRLWDGGTLSPAAAIKIVRHNLLRPTALVHEAGHQVAHILAWNEELAEVLRKGLASASTEIAETCASWASEIAADAFAFVHTGYAAVAALHDVLCGPFDFVFRFSIGDPHPVCYIRILLGTAMCLSFFGNGPWNDLAIAWKKNYALERVRPELRRMLEQSENLLPKITELTMFTPMQAFSGRALTKLVDPVRVRPDVLENLDRQTGPALYTSHYLIRSESLRLLALSGWYAATQVRQINDILTQQEKWIVRLGDL